MKKIIEHIKKFFENSGDWINGLFLDERGSASSKRFVGIVCALTLCASLYYSSICTATVHPSDTLIDAVALLAFGCLGLTSIDKYVNVRKKKGTDTPS